MRRIFLLESQWMEWSRDRGRHFVFMANGVHLIGTDLMLERPRPSVSAPPSGKGSDKAKTVEGPRSSGTSG